MNDLWAKLDPGFLQPIWLAVGFVAIVAVLLLELGARRRRNQAIRQFAASHLIATLTASVSPARRILKRFLVISAVGLLFAAMARPHLLYDWREESRTGLDILIAVDCSKSMLTEDVKPSRLERAKLALADFAEHLPNNRLGLIAFAGDAFLQCPLTLDHDAFQTAVRELDTDSIPRPGTDVATAITQAIEALKSQSNNTKFLILVTDGEDLEGRALDAAKDAAQAGLKIYTVGVGTAAGDLIPERDDSGNVTYHHDASGQIVQSKLDENTLRQIATITGGAYVPLGQRGEGLEEIYNQYIATLPRQVLEERREKIPVERFEWPLGLAILFLMWEFMTSERAKTGARTNVPSSTPSRRSLRRRKTPDAVATTLLLAFGFVSATTARASTTATAESDYKSGKYDDAAQNYEKATEVQPNQNELQYDLGDATYKAGKYTEAEEAFRKALNTPDLGLQENTYFNLGNAQFKHGEALQKVDTQKTIDLWEKSLSSYTSSLKLKPSADAKHNYEVVKQKLEQLKQQQKQQQDKNNQNQQDKKDKTGKDSKGSDGKNPSDSPNQQDQNNPQNGQNQQSQQQKPGDKQNPDKQPGSPDQNQSQNGQPQPSDAKDKNSMKTYSGVRNQDKEDPGVKSRQEAEALLDSLKDDEHHITSKVLNANNEQPPPPPSGKDW